MADDGKKKIKIDMEINPFGEFKGKKAPPWFEARPKLDKIVEPIVVKKDMMVDPRKWKVKDLEKGVYGVARYELKLFEAGMSAMQKDIDKAIPKEDKKSPQWKSFKDKKSTPKEMETALSSAETKVQKLYNKISKQILDKVSLALDEVESGKEDSKAALAAGKKALATFETLDFKKMYAEPASKASAALKTLQNELTDEGENKDALRKASQSIGKDAQDAFEKTAKKVSNVLKFLQDQGKKMKDDKNADALKNIGTKIVGMKSTLSGFEANIDTFEEMLKDVMKEIDGGKITKSDVNKWIKQFDGAQSKFSKGKDARDQLKKIAADFKKVTKDLK